MDFSQRGGLLRSLALVSSSSSDNHDVDEYGQPHPLRQRKRLSSLGRRSYTNFEDDEEEMDGGGDETSEVEDEIDIVSSEDGPNLTPTGQHHSKPVFLQHHPLVML